MGKVFGLGLVLSALYFYFFTYETYNLLSIKIQGLKAEMEKEKVIQVDTDKTLKKAMEVKESVALLSQQYEKISKSLPASLSTTDVMGFVDNFAKSAKVRVTSKNPQPPQKREIIEELPVSLVLSGTYFEIGRFIREVSVYEPITRVADYKITRDANPTSSKYVFEGRLKGYRSLEVKSDGEKK